MVLIRATENKRIESRNMFSLPWSPWSRLEVGTSFLTRKRFLAFLLWHDSKSVTILTLDWGLKLIAYKGLYLDCFTGYLGAHLVFGGLWLITLFSQQCSRAPGLGLALCAQSPKLSLCQDQAEASFSRTDTIAWTLQGVGAFGSLSYTQL